MALVQLRLQKSPGVCGCETTGENEFKKRGINSKVIIAKVITI